MIYGIPAILMIFSTLVIWQFPAVLAGPISSDFVVSGNERTDGDYVKKLALDCRRNDLPLEQCLMNSRLFSRVLIEQDQAAGPVKIKVEERWTLIPLPYYRSQKDVKGGGIFLMESNFLGRGKLLGFGASFSTTGHSLMLMFRDPSVNMSEYTAGINLRMTREDYYFYTNAVKTNGFNSKERTADLSPGIRLRWDLTLNLNLGLAEREFSELPPYSFRPFAEVYKTSSIGPGIAFTPTQFKFYFQEGHQLKLSMNQQLSRNAGGRKLSQLNFSHDYQFSPYSDHALQWQFQTTLFNGGDIKDTVRIGGRPGLRGLPISAYNPSGRKLFISSVDYQIPFSRPSYGTWTVSPFIDLSFLGMADLPYRRIFSYGMGAYLFLTKVAIPGLGLVLGRNHDPAEGFATFSIGRNF